MTTKKKPAKRAAKKAAVVWERNVAGHAASAGSVALSVWKHLGFCGYGAAVTMGNGPTLRQASTNGHRSLEAAKAAALELAALVAGWK
jgi:hypothetical protein